MGSSFVANGLAQGTSAVLPRPGGTVDGDRLLAFISIGNSGAITAPAGWVELPLTDVAFATLQSRIYTKVASGEPASWAWTFSSAAYVGIAHVTRGVGGIFAADQDDDGVSLLAHTTPNLPAPTGAWLVSSWTGRNLLALGWTPPAGDTERQDVIGGLLILLNVNHAVDDTNNPVAAGSYSKSALTLIAVRAFSGLVVLAPTLDPVQVQALKSPVSFGSLALEPGLLLGVTKSPCNFGDLSVGHTLTLTHILSPYLFGTELVELSILTDEIESSVLFGLFGIDPEITLMPLDRSILEGSYLLELELQLQQPLPVPEEFGQLSPSLLVELPDLLSPVDFDSEILVLPEQTVLLDHHLPIPIIPGSGFLWGLTVLLTMLADEEPGMIELGTAFGSMPMWLSTDPSGACCPA